MAVNTEVDLKRVEEIIKNWSSKESFLIEILQDIQDEYNYLPREALAHISSILKVPLSRIYHIATFYKAFSLEPKGKYLISVCMGTACHVKGGPRILDAFCRELGIQPGETTRDRKFTVDSVRCLGCCGLAAVVTVNDDLYGQVTPGKVKQILKKYD